VHEQSCAPTETVADAAVEVAPGFDLLIEVIGIARVMFWPARIQHLTSNFVKYSKGYNKIDSAPSDACHSKGKADP
jgi:hypothetical protein